MTIRFALFLILLCGSFLSKITAQQSTPVLISVVKSNSDSIPLPYANVALLDHDSLFIQGTLTDEKGYFCIANDEKRGEFVCVSYLGYEPIYISVRKIPRIIYLNASGISLKEVWVTGHHQYVKQSSDGLSVSLEGNPIAQLGTAYDVLQQIPLIDGSGGTIQVIGKGVPEIYIDNRLVRNQEALWWRSNFGDTHSYS